MKHNLLVACILILLQACSGPSKEIVSKEGAEKEKFIKPPLDGVDVPYKVYKIVAEKGDTLFYESGSIIQFLPNSLLDKNGNPVKGIVDISYREFADPLDFFLSGIPMDYDSNGVRYSFESAGMMEIKANQDGEPVFVNPDARPVINLSSSFKDEGFNLYALDTVNKGWINKGKDEVVVISDKKFRTTRKDVSEASLELTAPPKPVKASDERPVFSIVIEPGALPELEAYNNLKFEVDPSDKTYNPKDAEVPWQTVDVDKGTIPGTYIVTFRSAKKKVSYVTRPVFEEKDYAEAMKLYEKRNKEYQKELAFRNKQERESKEQYEKLKAENEKVMRYNALIEARNRRMDEINKNVLEQKRVMREKFMELERQKQQKDFAAGGQEMASQVFRTFSIDGFGTWNCDNPLLLQTIPMMATFKSRDGKELKPDNAYVVIKNLNGILPCNPQELRLIPNSESMIWFIQDKKLVYLTYKDFKNYKVDPEMKNIEFAVTVHPDEIKSRDDVRKILDM